MKEDRKNYLLEYAKANVRVFGLKVNKIHEKDIVEWLENKESYNQYLKQLIREDMEKQSRT